VNPGQSSEIATRQAGSNVVAAPPQILPPPSTKGGQGRVRTGLSSS